MDDKEFYELIDTSSGKPKFDADEILKESIKEVLIDLSIGVVVIIIIVIFGINLFF